MYGGLVLDIGAGVLNMNVRPNIRDRSAFDRALRGSTKHATGAALGAALIATAMLPHAASATVSGTFDGTIGGVSSVNFGGLTFASGDDYTGTFDYTATLGNIDTFSFTITDTTSSQTFNSLGAGISQTAPPTGTVGGTAGAFSVSATDYLDYGSTYTDFDATLSLSGSLDPTVFPGADNFIAGAGSLFIYVPAEPIAPPYNVNGNPVETLDVGLNIPEPMSLSLFGFGLAGLAAARRRAKR